MATDFTCCFKARSLKRLSEVNLGVQDAACVGFANWWESSLSASLDPGHSEESRQGWKDIGTSQGLVLVFRVGSWATEGVKKALIHTSSPQARHGVWVMFLHGTLSPESPWKFPGNAGIVFLPLPTFLSCEEKWSWFLCSLYKLLFFKWGYS